MREPAFVNAAVNVTDVPEQITFDGEAVMLAEGVATVITFIVIVLDITALFVTHWILLVSMQVT